MKITRIDDNSYKFKPVSINLTFETEAELGVFYAMFNFCPITDTIDSIESSLDHAKIRRALDNDQWDTFPRSKNKYWDLFFKGLEKRIR